MGTESAVEPWCPGAHESAGGTMRVGGGRMRFAAWSALVIGTLMLA
ncbi:MAG: hypothetical protein R6V57_18515 [Vicinamibacterales bacterium]